MNNDFTILVDRRKLEYKTQPINLFDFFNDDKLIILSANNKKILCELFGKQNYVITSEFKHYVWHISHRNLEFIIFTGKRGTSIEVIKNCDCYICNHKYDETKSFLLELYNIIKNGKTQ